MYVKIHKANTDTILAACDEDLIGKTFKGNGMKITVNEGFYKGDIVSKEEFIQMLESVSIMNLVGEEVVSIVIDEGFASPDHVIKIDGVKHLQVVLM